MIVTTIDVAVIMLDLVGFTLLGYHQNEHLVLELWLIRIFEFLVLNTAYVISSRC